MAFRHQNIRSERQWRAVTGLTEAQFDGLLDSVDLNTYGLERSRVSAKIVLDPDGGTLNPTDAKPRSVHDDGDCDELDNIIATFNETHFSDWSATAEKKRARLISLRDRFRADARFESQFQATTDPSNRQRLKDDMIVEAVQGSRDENRRFCRLWATDPAFKTYFLQALGRMLEGEQGTFGV